MKLLKTLPPNLNGISSETRQALIAAAYQKAKKRVEARTFNRQAYELRGNNLAVQTMQDEEILLVGAAGTGKTLAILKKLHDIAWAYPGARIGIVRKVRADLAQTTLVTFERDILGLNNPICRGVLRENRMSYRYPNGSEIVVGGMDRPGKVLSGEYHVFYVAEAVEMTENDWEFLLMRLGRDGVVPFSQLIADTNPSHPEHWLKKRCDAGQCKLLDTFHKDNPAYWDGTDWTPAGRNYVLGKLGRLSGVRKLRFLDGKWVLAEGMILEDYRESIHLIDRFEIPAEWRRYRVTDFGYTHPFVCQWWAEDPDGRLYRYREIYKTRRLVEDHAADINRLSEGERIEFTVADHDAEGRATLESRGIRTIAAKKDVLTGIQTMQSRLRVQEDGKPRIFFLRDSLVERDADLEADKKPLCTEQEIPAYVWSDKSKKEQPVKEDDHGVDCVRYMTMALENRPQKARYRAKNPIFG